MRATLATVKALELNMKTCWLVIVGPPSSGKTERDLLLASAYPGNKEVTGDISIPGLISMERGHQGDGLLQRLGIKGLWIIKDLSSVVSMRPEKRNEFLAAMREVYDGHWDRTYSGTRRTWVGHINLVAGATSAFERYSSIVSELGDRYVIIRVTRPIAAPGLWRKASRQAGAQAVLRRELLESAAAVLASKVRPLISDEWQGRVMAAAELVALVRTPVLRDYRHEIMDISDTEGPIRLYQELEAILVGDAANHGQETVSDAQEPLLERLTLDSMPYHRGNIIRNMPLDSSIRRNDLYELTKERWDMTFERTIPELLALGVISHHNEERESWYSLSNLSLRLFLALSGSHPIT